MTELKILLVRTTEIGYMPLMDNTPHIVGSTVRFALAGGSVSLFSSQI
jgi:hypothetical protein